MRGWKYLSFAENECCRSVVFKIKGQISSRSWGTRSTFWIDDSMSSICRSNRTYHIRKNSKRKLLRESSPAAPPIWVSHKTQTPSVSWFHITYRHACKYCGGQKGQQLAAVPSTITFLVSSMLPHLYMYIYICIYIICYLYNTQKPPRSHGSQTQSILQLREDSLCEWKWSRLAVQR